MVRREARRRALRNGVGVDIVVVEEDLEFEIYDDGSMFSEFIRARIYLQLTPLTL